MAPAYHEDHVGLAMETLPSEVVKLLRTARYLHLGTADYNATPSVSLMNYTYVEDATEPEVILTTRTNTKKFANVSANPKVSLLVHGFGTHRQLDNEGSSLNQFLLNLNQSALESISATLNGHATVLEGPDAEAYKTKHCASNPEEAQCFIMNPEIAVILVRITSCRTSDQQDHVERWGNGGQTPAS